MVAGTGSGLHWPQCAGALRSGQGGQVRCDDGGQGKACKAASHEGLSQARVVRSQHVQGLDAEVRWECRGPQGRAVSKFKALNRPGLHAQGPCQGVRESSDSVLSRCDK